MKKIALALLSAIIILTGCSKEGPAGKDGINGTNGINGKDGSKIYSGTTTPPTTTGIDGDFYIDLTNGLLFGPKSSSNWGTGVSIKGKNGVDGTNGTNGKDGATFLSGIYQPTYLIGKDGDYYLDVTTTLLYGPKTSGNWPTTATLLKGKDGINGVNGKDGTIIYSGLGSPTLNLGVVGDFYIDKTLYVMFGPKTSSGWGTGTVLKGTNGVDGATILSGYGYPSSTVGRTGDFYIDLSGGLLYGPKSISDWGFIGLQLRGNANVRTYIFGNPWNNYYSEQPSFGLFRFFFGGIFQVSSFEADNGLVLGFIESTFGTNKVWAQAGTTHSNFLGVNYNSSFEIVNSAGTITGVFIKVGNNLLNNSSTTDWTDMTDVQNKTGITRVKIIVIPQSTLSIMGFKKDGLDSKNIQLLADKLQIGK